MTTSMCKWTCVILSCICREYESDVWCAWKESLYDMFVFDMCNALKRVCMFVGRKYIIGHGYLINTIYFKLRTKVKNIRNINSILSIYPQIEIKFPYLIIPLPYLLINCNSIFLYYSCFILLVFYFLLIFYFCSWLMITFSSS